MGNGCNETGTFRSALEVYTKDGDLLAVQDCQGNYTVEQLIAFAKLCREKSDLTVEKVFQSWVNI